MPRRQRQRPRGLIPISFDSAIRLTRLPRDSTSTLRYWQSGITSRILTCCLSVSVCRCRDDRRSLWKADHLLVREIYQRSQCMLVSFQNTAGNRRHPCRFMQAPASWPKPLKLVQSATTLGDVCSLALYPAMSSHRALSNIQRHEAGISDGLIRLSVGLEDPQDILADLDQALRGVSI